MPQIVLGTFEMVIMEYEKRFNRPVPTNLLRIPPEKAIREMREAMRSGTPLEEDPAVVAGMCIP